MNRRDDTFAWVVERPAAGGTSRTKTDVGSKAKKSVWDRIAGRDDDDMPGPNAGATLWPRLPRKSAAAFA